MSIGKLCTSQDNTYTGEWRHDKLHGMGVVTHANGSVNKGRFVEGKQTTGTQKRHGMRLFRLSLFCAHPLLPALPPPPPSPRPRLHFPSPLLPLSSITTPAVRASLEGAPMYSFDILLPAPNPPRPVWCLCPH